MVGGETICMKDHHRITLSTWEEGDDTYLPDLAWEKQNDLVLLDDDIACGAFSTSFKVWDFLMFPHF